MSEPAALPEAADWRASARANRLEEALGRLRALETVGQGEPAARTALEEAVGLLEALRARDYPEAGRRAARLQPFEGVETAGLTDALAALSRGASAQGADPEAAALAYREALGPLLTRAEAENGLGVLEAQAGRGESARAHFEAALEADPKHYRAIANLGNLELEAGRLTDAEARYREAIRLNDAYGTAHHNLAAALRRQGKRGESVAALKRANRLAAKERRPSAGGPLPPLGRAAPPRAGMGSVLRWVVIGAVLYLLYRLLVR